MADLPEAGHVAVNFYIERRIRQHQVGALAFEQPGVIAVAASIPTQQAVRAKDPKIALSGNRSCNNRRKIVFRTRTDRLFLGGLVQDDIDLAQRKTGDLDIVELQVIERLILDRESQFDFLKKTKRCP